MTTMRTLMLLAGLGATALAGCGADVPEHPTWQNDVYPIVEARCIRCHNSGKTMDPLSMPGVPVQGNFDFPSYDQLQDLDRLLFLGYAADLVADSDEAAVMPPPPAARLAQWQIDTITRFVKDNKPTQ